MHSPPKLFIVPQKYLPSHKNIDNFSKNICHQVQYTVPSVYHHAAPLHYAYAHPYMGVSGMMTVAAEHKMVEEA